VLPPECTLDIMQSLLKEKLKETFPYLTRAKEIEFLPKGKTFITQRYLGGEVTTQELIEWTEAGFKVCIHGFDPENPKEDRARAHAQCKATKATCKKPFTVVKEEMKGGVPPTPRRPGTIPQIDVAREMLRQGEARRQAPTAPFVPIVPTKYQGKVEGMGRRAGRGARKKTAHRAKLRRRGTRRRIRGGVEDELDPTHPGVQIAEGLVGRNPPALNPNAPIFTPTAVRQSPLQMMFDRITRDLMLTPVEIAYMLRTYEDALQRGVTISEAQLRLHMERRKRAHVR
jgi:hypothetical protein